MDKKRNSDITPPDSADRDSTSTSTRTSTSTSTSTSSVRLQFCLQHSEDRIVDFSIKRHVREDEDKAQFEAKFRTPRSKLKSLSTRKRKWCKFLGCSKQPSYGVYGSTNAVYCAPHAGNGMVDVGNKKCAHESCAKQPSYGVEGSKRAVFCSQHAPNGMVNVSKKRCNSGDCTRQASYGVVGSGYPEFCSRHPKRGMVNVCKKMCAHGACIKQPKFGPVGTKTAKFCSQHAEAGMVDVRNKICGEFGCTKQPSFGVEGSKSAAFCASHASKGMVNVRTKKRHPGEGLSKAPGGVRRVVQQELEEGDPVDGEIDGEAEGAVDGRGAHHVEPSASSVKGVGKGDAGGGWGQPRGGEEPRATSDSEEEGPASEEQFMGFRKRRKAKNARR